VENYFFFRLVHWVVCTGHFTGICLSWHWITFCLKLQRARILRLLNKLDRTPTSGNLIDQQQRGLLCARTWTASGCSDARALDAGTSVTCAVPSPPELRKNRWATNKSTNERTSFIHWPTAVRCILIMHLSIHFFEFSLPLRFSNPNQWILLLIQGVHVVTLRNTGVQRHLVQPCWFSQACPRHCNFKTQYINKNFVVNKLLCLLCHS